MPFEVKVPQLGESVVEATVGQWHKNVGDSVNVGEPLLELETDKVDLEVSAEQAGVLQSVAYHAGDTVKIGDILGVIGEGGASNGTGQTTGVSQTTPSAPPVETIPTHVSAPEAISPTATPLARRVAEDKGIDLGSVPATGPRGRTTKDDVLSYLAQSTQPTSAPAEVAKPIAAPASKPAPAAQTASPVAQVREREERVHMSRRRKVIAERLVAAQQTAAMLTTFNEIDMTAVMDIRKRRKEKFLEKHKIGLGFMSFFTKASIGALKAFPRLNAEIQGDDLIIKYHYDIGVAIGAEEGLVVPVVRDTDRLSFAEIERAISNFSAKSKAGTLSLEDLRGGTFTITNGGIFGSLMSTPILNPPQVGILGMHKIQERPMAVNGQIVIRPMMYVALTYDHRIVDGREAVQFLVRIKELLEDPESLMLEG